MASEQVRNVVLGTLLGVGMVAQANAGHGRAPTQEARQLAAVAFAHLGIAQDKRMPPEFMEWNLLVDEQCVPGWQGDHQRVLPDGLRHQSVADVRSVCETDREVAGSQPPQLFRQGDLGEPYFDLRLLLAAQGKKCRQPRVDGAIGDGDAHAASELLAHLVTSGVALSVPSPTA